MSAKAYITPDVFKWARTSAHISIETAAKAVAKEPEMIQSWENGRDVPTIKQAEKLAHLYRRPLAVFFLPGIPYDFTVLQDFRSVHHGEFSTALIFMMREVQQKQAWARTALEEDGETVLPFVGRFDRRTSVETVALDIRQTLKVVTSEMNGNGLKYWLQKAEEARIFVCLSSSYHTRMKIDSDVVKGFAIADPYAPFVFLNSDDWENPQLFTLVHELVHVWINQSGISVDTQFGFREVHSSTIDPVEVYCNKVAANALLPLDELETEIGSLPLNNFDQVKEIARKFSVSTLTLLYRLSDSGRITDRQLSTWKRIADEQFSEFAERHRKLLEQSEGGANYYLLLARRNGRAFSKMVLDFYKGGQISGIELSNLLNVKLNMVSKLEQQLYH
jgi:Zn-dependent peptidase ImmA (M78 family)